MSLLPAHQGAALPDRRQPWLITSGTHGHHPPLLLVLRPYQGLLEMMLVARALPPPLVGGIVATTALVLVLLLASSLPASPLPAPGPAPATSRKHLASVHHSKPEEVIRRSRQTPVIPLPPASKHKYHPQEEQRQLRQPKRPRQTSSIVLAALQYPRRFLAP